MKFLSGTFICFGLFILPVLAQGVPPADQQVDWQAVLDCLREVLPSAQRNGNVGVPYISDKSVSHIACLRCDFQLPDGRKANLQVELCDTPEKRKEATGRSTLTPVGPSMRSLPVGEASAGWKGYSGYSRIYFLRGDAVVNVSGDLDWETLLQTACVVDGIVQRGKLLAVIKQLADKTTARQKAEWEEVERKKAAGEAAKVVPPKEREILLAKLASDGFQNTSEWYPTVRRLSTGRVTEAVPLLIIYLDNSKYHSWTVGVAASALRELGDKRAIAPLVAVLNRPVTGDTSKDNTEEAVVRESAAQAIAAFDDPAVTALLKRLAAGGREYLLVTRIARETLETRASDIRLEAEMKADAEVQARLEEQSRQEMAR